jgi:hypothetical protein
MTMRFMTDPTGADQEQDLRVLAARWPQFSARELGRLCFLRYRCRTGRLRSPAPVSAEVEALCAALCSGTGPAAPDLPQPTVWLGVPLLWAAWAAQQCARRRNPMP